jgi:hypothetical protein
LKFFNLGTGLEVLSLEVIRLLRKIKWSKIALIDCRQREGGVFQLTIRIKANILDGNKIYLMKDNKCLEMGYKLDVTIINNLKYQ